ncbi:MAG: recombinase family protein, partial [bacterium]|nr:recombinase family protein [bacterium]
MNLEEIIQRIRATRSLPSDEDLRRLPYLKAFIYGRVSSQIQVKESRESIRDIAKQVMKAKKDGYKSNLDPDEVEKWLALIQSGADVPRVLEDGDIIVDCSDLGLSGSLDEDKRPGLAHLQRRVESGEVGAVYLTEGMSRLSRDRDRVLGYRLLKLLKQHTCRIRTVEGVYNPAIPRDWDHLAEDVDKSAEEMKTSGIRMGNRRAEKAAEGEHVGSPVCPGYIVPIVDKNRDGSYVFAKWQVYPPHQQVVIEA